MYLSRLILNPRNRRVQSEIANPYEMHRTILHAFPYTLDKEAERVLYRLEENPRTATLNLLVQSFTPPDWSWLESEPGARGYLLPVGFKNPDAKTVDLRLVRGQVLAFRLLANPTVKRDGKRRGLCREEEQIEWLARKAEQGGFRILSARTSNQAAVRGHIRRQQEEASHKLLFLAVQFDGLLQVADPERLVVTVHQGVGSGKGLGFGLLSLAPPK